MPLDVIMPALGMAQDTGLIVAWHKQPGDAVAKGDVLFEVETDKATMEVEAQGDGYLTDVTAHEGIDVPVGHVIARISASAENTATEAKSEVAASCAPTTHTTVDPLPAPPAQSQPIATTTHRPHATAGRILASPKLRRLAHQQGLDLAKLIQAGYAQPFHVKDLDALKALPTALSPGAASAQTPCRLTANVPTEGFTAFAPWAAETAKLTDTAALLAGLTAASMGKDTAVAVERFGEVKTYAASPQLSATRPSDDPPELRLRDLRFSAITTVQVGAEDVPTLTLTRSERGLAITLEYAGDQLSAPAAISLLSNFAGRIEQPLRHLF